ncbi:MAG: helix-turn-helix transcriptional regulator [Solirubrobacteraceae bacterium MAG38_C4-C5]|nr:helix-turn-helix transcriptional regulator [Candidatus Siliceabacter maunaloa]
MALAFRNVGVSVSDPIETWPSEAVHTALERGGIAHWRRLSAAIDADPWGPVARRVEEAVADPPYGVGSLMAEIIATARDRVERSERADVAAEIARLVADSGLTGAQFAHGIGTSGPRLSTYLAGTVTPSAALLVRMRRLAARG